MLGAKGLKWAGFGLPDDCDTQVVETEDLKADEYDLYISDRSGFMLRYYLPRAYKAAEPLGKLPPLEFMRGGFAPFADPDVLDAFKMLGEAGKLDIEWHKMIGGIHQKALEKGIPMFSQGLGGGAPFDGIGVMRGTMGTIMDMFKQPKNIIKVMERHVESTKKMLSKMSNIGGSPVIMMPLHRGADGWMSEEQFLTFYWPYFKQVIMAFVEEGFVPSLFAEGGYNSRLEIIKELPAGKVIWHLDRTDIFKAKEVLGDRACLMGNVPSSLLVTGTPEEVKAHCKELIEKVGPGGGYILSYGATPNHSKIENIIAMRESAREFGVYKK
jgi:hypothetical protein